MPVGSSSSGSEGSASLRTSKLKSPVHHVNMVTTANSMASRQRESIRSAETEVDDATAAATSPAAGVRLLDRGLEILVGEEAAAYQHAAQILGSALDRRATHQAVDEDDPAVGPGRLQHKHAGLLGEADDLQNVPEAQILETADQAHFALPPATNDENDAPRQVRASIPTEIGSAGRGWT